MFVTKDESILLRWVNLWDLIKLALAAKRLAVADISESIERLLQFLTGRFLLTCLART